MVGAEGPNRWGAPSDQSSHQAATHTKFPSFVVCDDDEREISSSVTGAGRPPEVPKKNFLLGGGRGHLPQVLKL